MSIWKRENPPEVIRRALSGLASNESTHAVSKTTSVRHVQQRRLIVTAKVREVDGTERVIKVPGQAGRALLELVRAGREGLTALDLGSWALRLAVYISTLRHRHGLIIETAPEPHEGPGGRGTHGRYVLRTHVRIVHVEGGQA